MINGYKKHLKRGGVFFVIVQRLEKNYQNDTISNLGFLFLIYLYVIYRKLPKILFIFFQGEGKEGDEKGEKHRCRWGRYINWLPLTCPHPGTWPTAQACALTRNQTSDLSVHRPALSPLSHINQGHFWISMLCIFHIILALIYCYTE